MSERASHLIIGGVDLEIWDTVARNGIGAPAVAGTVAAMTDTSKVYVYTGSESGYTAGNWYYYNGSAWVSGGVYNSTAFETDETLTQEGKAADAKAAGDAIADVQSALVNKANVDGAYEQMTVGNAEQLVSNVGIEDSVPYNFRTSGGSADIGDREVDKIVGGTIAWNQLVHEMNSDYWEGPTGKTFSDGVVTFTPTSTYQFLTVKEAHRPKMQAGHKYYFSCDVKSVSQSIGVGVGNPGSFASTGLYVRKTTGSSGTYERYERINAWLGNDGYYAATLIMTFASSDWTEINAKNFVLFDLTQMFGSTIADYIYALETANEGAGVAWFRKLFPKPYYAYNAGELMSVQTSAHKMVGFNLFDKTTADDGYVYNRAGSKNVSYPRSTGLVRVLPNMSYYLKSPYYESVWNAVFFDINGNGLNDAVQVSSGGTGVLFTTPANCYYVGINMLTKDKDEICLNLSWDGERDGEYEEYKQWVYPLDSDLVLRGIPKLSSGNDLYYDGDTYESDGMVKRRFAVKVLNGTENWKGADSSGHCWVQDDSIMRSNVSGIPYTQMMISNVRVASSSYYFGTVTEPTVSAWGGTTSGTDNYWYFAAPNVEDTAVAIKAYLAQHPVTVVYMLAEPTTESADPFTNPQIVDDFGTEEYVDARDVAIPVGHETFYQNNLKAKLEMAPNSPDGDGDYVVRQANGKNEYVPLLFPASDIPAAPSENGNYVLKCTVANGTPSFSWTAES